MKVRTSAVLREERRKFWESPSAVKAQTSLEISSGNHDNHRARAKSKRCNTQAGPPNPHNF